MEWYPLRADRNLFILSQKLEGDRIILHLFNYGLVPVVGISHAVDFVCFLYGFWKLYAIFMGLLEVSGFYRFDDPIFALQGVFNPPSKGG